MCNLKKSVTTLTLCLTTILSSLNPTLSHAGGGGPGNGGDAIFYNGKWTLLDLAEAGVTDPVLPADRQKQIQSLPKALFSKIDTTVDEKFSNPKFSSKFKDELKAFLALSEGSLLFPLLSGIQLYDWRLTGLLEPIGDNQDGPLDLKRYSVKHLASRIDSSIEISEDVFNLLSPEQQTALIVHEVLYALLNVTKGADGFDYQSSWRAREVVGALFTEGVTSWYRFGNGPKMRFNISSIENLTSLRAGTYYGDDTTTISEATGDSYLVWSHSSIPEDAIRFTTNAFIEQDSSIYSTHRMIRGKIDDDAQYTNSDGSVSKKSMAQVVCEYEQNEAEPIYYAMFTKHSSIGFQEIQTKRGPQLILANDISYEHDRRDLSTFVEFRGLAFDPKVKNQGTFTECLDRVNELKGTIEQKFGERYPLMR